MEDLIKALQIFLKYENPEWPTHCEHDKLHIIMKHPEKVSEEDKKELDKLGFDWDEYDECFYSYKYGSA